MLSIVNSSSSLSLVPSTSFNNHSDLNENLPQNSTDDDEDSSGLTDEEEDEGEDIDEEDEDLETNSLSIDDTTETVQHQQSIST